MHTFSIGHHIIWAAAPNSLLFYSNNKISNIWAFSFTSVENRSLNFTSFFSPSHYVNNDKQQQCVSFQFRKKRDEITMEMSQFLPCQMIDGKMIFRLKNYRSKSINYDFEFSPILNVEKGKKTKEEKDQQHRNDREREKTVGNLVWRCDRIEMERFNDLAAQANTNISNRFQCRNIKEWARFKW